MSSDWFTSINKIITSNRAIRDGNFITFDFYIILHEREREIILAVRSFKAKQTIKTGARLLIKPQKTLRYRIMLIFNL